MKVGAGHETMDYEVLKNFQQGGSYEPPRTNIDPPLHGWGPVGRGSGLHMGRRCVLHCWVGVTHTSAGNWSLSLRTALSSEPYLSGGVPMICREDSGVPRPRGDSSEPPRLNFSADCRRERAKGEVRNRNNMSAHLFVLQCQFLGNQ